MTRFGDGLAVDLDLARAAALATRQALEPLQGRAPDLLCLFVCTADPADVEAVGRQVAELSRARSLVGCSAAGVIGAGRAVETSPAVSVWAAELPGARVQGFHLDTVRTDDTVAVLGMPQRASDDAFALLLGDAYTFPADGFIERSNDALPGLTFVGGLTTGLGGAGSTRLLLDGEVYDRGAVGVLLGGQVGARSVVSQGCRPIGPTMTVTRAEGNVVLELAGVPALTKLEQIVAELPEAEQAFVFRGLHIGLAMDEYADEHERGDFLVRGVIGADRERGGLAVGDLVEVGRSVRFQVRDAAAADEELADTLGGFRRRLGRDPVEGALLFSCNGRGSTLFASADHDVVAVREAFGVDAVSGFFAAGEVGPVGGRNHLHGFTASLLAFGGHGKARSSHG
ncbi:MAG: FIST signal transduction protein [Carbonactinosporaceae bacterium]